MKCDVFTPSLARAFATARKTTFCLLILSGALFGFTAVKAQDSSACTARFTTSISQNHASFQAADTQASVLHYWNFGDGTSIGFSTHYASVTHVYDSSGTYKVSHIIRDSLNRSCYDSTYQNISISLPPACQISFQSYRDSLNPHLYSFISTPVLSGGRVDSIFWFINDTLVGVGQNLSNHYFAGGVYTICVRLLTTKGCVAEQCSQLNVGVSGSTCGLYAYFNYTADSSNPQLIKFSPVPDSSQNKYYWNFGDGSSSSARTPSHLYASGGTYPITLRITVHSGLDSCVADTTESIYVAPKDTCKVGFMYKADPKKASEIHFSADSARNIDSVTWIITRISDSTILTVLSGKTPVYTFQDPGCYSVYMSAKTSKGCVSSATGILCLDSIPSKDNGFIASYPNPATGQVYLDLHLPGDYAVRFSIFNTMGYQVQVNTIAGFKGQNHFTIPIGSLPSGLYYAQIQYGNERFKSRIQKL
jgi:PKD repeat protein